MADGRDLSQSERQGLSEWLVGARDYFAYGRPAVATWAAEALAALQDEGVRQQRLGERLEEDVSGVAEFLGPDSSVPPIVVERSIPADPLDSELGEMLENRERNSQELWNGTLITRRPSRLDLPPPTCRS